MFMYQKESLLLMQLKSGLQSQVDVFWLVMEVPSEKGESVIPILQSICAFWAYVTSTSTA